MKKADLLKEALGIVEKRGLSYGKPENNFKRIAELWEIYINQRESQANVFIAISETDVATLMVLMKVARLMEKPDHLDSWLDIAGYAACGAEVSGAGENTEQTLDEWLGTGGDPGDEMAEMIKDAMLHGTGVGRVHTDGVEHVGLDDFRGDSGVVVSPSGVDIHPAVHVNVQNQTRKLKAGDRVVSKKPYESTWVGTVKFLQALSGLVQVEWRSVGRPTEHPWNTLHRPEELEIAAVPS